MVRIKCGVCDELIDTTGCTDCAITSHECSRGWLSEQAVVFCELHTIHTLEYFDDWELTTPTINRVMIIGKDRGVDYQVSQHSGKTFELSIQDNGKTYKFFEN